jgi:putative peptidoglycan lipid II flippase
LSRLTLLAAIPLAGILYLFSDQIVTLFFQRGAFTERDAMLVAQVQALYGLQIPFYILGILYARLLSSLGANRVLMWSTAITFPVNAVLDVVLARFLGVAGIALATTVMYIVGCSFLAVILRRLLGVTAPPNAGEGVVDHLRAEQMM